ncbi:MAG: sensor histidine kinase [Thermoanaerobaculia bacterium]
MHFPSRIFSRISLRLMLFNLLLVFLPIAGVLLLGTYEQNLESTELEAMQRQARLLVAMIQTNGVAALSNAAPVARQIGPNDGRVRVVNPEGRVIVDSGPLADTGSDDENSSPQHNWLYRAGAALLKKPMQWLRPATHPLTSSEAYERSPVLRGREVQDALVGLTGTEKRVSSAPDRQVMLYTAVPIYERGNVIGAVVMSRPTDDIRQDIHAIRLSILQIFLISIVLAMILTLMVSTTIVRPLRQLRKEAGEILDRRGRLRGRFKGSQKRDEIGDLSRALERLTRRHQRHQQATEAFASDVSHEFKNPLASIRMATEMLSQVDTPNERARFLRITESEIARMENLLSQVREITVIDAEIQKEDRSEVDIAKLLRRIVEGFRLREKDRVIFDLNTGEKPLIVHASEDRLLQVFENILDNAVSFSPRGSTVTVNAAAHDRSIVVRVRDRGAGIPAENLGRIFDRFFTYRPEEQRNHRHTGLGLSIVKAIVEGYGGSVTAANEAEGGAEFEVRLPA